ncbi:UPF0182 family protein [Corynebacterium caspium]|uniref:UPF0182 family protein n=1 Tax=Corynebacterium caspium TaxID=234828 RepID=UPI00037377E8|nr:UPF0182 family protein [Corynebacterium caspium]WKD59681.1 hypothetical protein CCASP_06510 [Corynebacterium caspium DSM 44850]
MASGFPNARARTRKPSRTLTGVIGILAILVFVAPMAIGFYTNWLWFAEVDFRGVFTRVLVARIILFLIFGILGALIIWATSFFTWKNRPREVESLEINSPVHQYRMLIAQSVRTLLIGLPIFVGIMAGVIGQVNWRTAMVFLNGHDFGVADSQFGKDLGFYAFTLPFLRLTQSTLTLLLVVAFIISLAGYYLLGGIRSGNKLQGIKGHISTPARVQLAVIAGLWMLVLIFGYWLDRFDLLMNEHGTFTGGSYTDINAHLPSKMILMIISVVVAAAFFASIIYRDLRVPALAIVLMVVSSLTIGSAWPMLMERFSVSPNRAAKESEFIARNIEATRYAYGLTDDKVTYQENWGAKKASNEAVATDEATISNIRLLDPQILSPTFTQQQQLRNFYGFPEYLAVDRYNVDGEIRDFVVAARELDPNSLQENQRDWINRHTVFTHGNGFIAAQANKVDEVARDVGSTRGGYPVYRVSDLQSMNKDAELRSNEEVGINVDQPRIYFGPVIASAADSADYAVVGSTGTDAEYDTDTSSYTYEGKAGVDIGNLANRVAFAVKYQEMNLLLSDRVGAESKIIFERDPRKRVEKVAPWLTTDSKTYPAVIDGRIKWIVDGYTTLSALPYSTRTQLQEVTEDASNPDGTRQRLLSNSVGYIRNSVKATVDAYDGTVELYEFDSEDPVLKVWESVFPGTVKPKSEISAELNSHLRYPEDMFKVQREILARYHVSDPLVFFQNDAFWSVPDDPTAPEARNALRQPPYYIVADDPATTENDATFQLITPFRGLNRQFLSAHMTVTSDPHNYGHITVRILPTDTQTQGPKQAQDTMMSSDQIARDRTLWQGTNDLRNGNLLTLPVGGGEILYVEPLYSQRKDQESAFPKLLRALVSYGGRVGYAPTIAEALAQVGIDPKAAQDIEVVEGDSAAKPAVKPADKDAIADAAGKPSGPATASGSEGEAIQRINDALNNLDRAKTGSFEEYGKALDELDAAVAAYQNR